MKLLFCWSCQDVVKLPTEGYRTCACGQCGGRYTDGRLHAEYWGIQAVLLGFNNSSLVNALQAPVVEFDRGVRFEAFVIPPFAPTAKHIPVPPVLEVPDA